MDSKSGTGITPGSPSLPAATRTPHSSISQTRERVSWTPDAPLIT